MVRLEKEAVLGANVVLKMSTKIIDVIGHKPIEMKDVLPSRSVVIFGNLPKNLLQMNTTSLMH
jgi:2,3,4,5-tetrahydropyridine-2-carboxylate N-succinyltransferase